MDIFLFKTVMPLRFTTWNRLQNRDHSMIEFKSKRPNVSVEGELCHNPIFQLRWLNTVLRAVSGNSRDGACFKILDKQTWSEKSNGTQKTISQNLLSKILWHLAEILLLSFLNNENFKIEVERANFVTHLSNDPGKVKSNFFCYAANGAFPT